MAHTGHHTAVTCANNLDAVSGASSGDGPNRGAADDGVRLHAINAVRQFRQLRARATQDSVAGPSAEGRQLFPQRQVFQDQFTMAAERNVSARTTTMGTPACCGSWPGLERS